MVTASVGTDVVTDTRSAFLVETTGTYLLLLNISADTGLGFIVQDNGSTVPGATAQSSGGMIALAQAVTLHANDIVTVQEFNPVAGNVNSASITFVRLQ